MISPINSQIPASSDHYPADIRWTGVLQRLLGDEFTMIEEGMGGRTVNIDVPGQHGYNGMCYFEPCLASHMPLNLVIIMLGTNDVKAQFNRGVTEIVAGIEETI